MCVCDTYIYIYINDIYIIYILYYIYIYNVLYILCIIYNNTSRARARRVAEVYRFKKCNAIGSKNKVCL